MADDRPTEPAAGAEDRLDSWKEIAAYLRTSVRTVQRWEKTEGLPVRRQRHAKQGSVYAFRSELERWRTGRELLFSGPETAIADGRAAAVDSSASSSDAPAATAADSWQSQLDNLRRQLEAESTGAAAIPSRRGPTVGRTRELGALTDGFDNAAAGSCRLLCVGGEAGIGKSTLLETFLAELDARSAPCIVARGRCSERLAGSEAYLPILEALEMLGSGPAGETVTAMLRLVAPTWWVQVAPLWVTAEPAYENVVADAKAATQERVKRELAAFVAELASVRPLVLILDDLHWADTSTVELIAYLVKRSASLPILVLGAYRTAEMLLTDHPFVAVRRELQERGICRELDVELLSRDDVDRYVEMDLPGHELPAELTDFIHRRTEGSPLFMADLLRHLRDRGVIKHSDGSWTLSRSLADIERDLPQSVRSMIERKIEQLDDGDRELLSVAAAQGQEFESAVVADVCGLDPAEVEERLTRLGEVHAFVSSLGERTLAAGTLSVRQRFVHVLYQNALQSVLAPSRRASLARDVAASLEKLYGDDNAPVAVELSLLYETARDAQRAADCFLLAAGRAAEVHAHDEVVTLCQRAIENAERLTPELARPRLRRAAQRLGFLYHVTARYEDALAQFHRLEELCELDRDDPGRVQAICAQANVYFYSKSLDRARAEATRALELARGCGDAAGAATAEALLGSSAMALGDIAECEILFDRAVPVLDKLGYTPSGLDASQYAILLHVWRLEHDEVQRACARWEQQARPHGALMMGTYFYKAMALGNQGKLSEAAAAARNGLYAAELDNNLFFSSRFPNTLGWIHHEMEDVERAIALNQDNVDMAAGLGFAEPEANAHVNLAQDFIKVGELDAAFEQLERAGRLFDADVWFRWRYYIRLQGEYAEYWLAREDLGAARAHADKALELALTSRATKHVARALAVLGELDVKEDRPADARTHLDRALQTVRGGACPRVEWRVLTALASLGRATRDAALLDETTRRIRAIVDGLAASIGEDGAREGFLSSRAARTIGE